MERGLTAGVKTLLEQAQMGDDEWKAVNTQQRKEYLAEDRYVMYPRARLHMERMQELVSAKAKVIRPENLMLVGETNNGKTSLVHQFIQQYAPPLDDPNEPSARIPVLYVLLRADVDEDRLYHWILDAMLAAYKDKDRQDKKFKMVAELVERLGIRMLIFDEFHHILTATGARQRRSVNTVKTLGSALQLSIVATGIPEVFSLLRTDPQIHNRFEALSLPRWEYGTEFRQFLAGLEMDLPLLNPSNLASPTLARHIYDFSEGLLGEAVKHLRRVAIRAVGGAEAITLEGSLALNPVPPSQRDADIERQLYGGRR